MRPWFTRAVLGGAAMIASAAPAGATVTFGDAYGNGASLASYSTAFASAVYSSGQYDSETDAPPAVTVATLPISPLSVNSRVFAFSLQSTFNLPDVKASANASNQTDASFSSAAGGTVSFIGGAGANANGGDGLAYASSGYYFQYYFSSDTAATFSIDYALSGPFLGCCGSTIQLQDRSNGTIYPINHTLYGGDLAGTLSADLIAGDTYGLTISMAEYLGTDAPYVRGVGSQSFTHNDRFDFAITSADAAVPEPASWALLIAGAGLVGGTLRRRRKPGITVRFA